MPKFQGFLTTTALCSIVLGAALPTVASAEETSSRSNLIAWRDLDFGAADRATAVYVADAEIESAATGDLKDLSAGIASVSVDGASQNSRVFRHTSANAFDPGLMRSVRVDPGVAPADAGPRALAGRVVMETIDAVDLLEEGKNFGGRGRLAFDSNGETLQSSHTVAGRAEGFEMFAYRKQAEGDNYEDGDCVLHRAHVTFGRLDRVSSES